MHLQQILLRYKFHHLLFWLLLGGLWYYLRYQDYSTTQRAVLVTTIKVIDLALMVYVANCVLIPKLLYRKKYSAFVSLFLLMITISSVTKMHVIGSILHNPALYHWTINLKARVYDNVIPHIFLVIAGAAFKLLLDYNSTQRRLLQTAKEKAETELNFLKAQINPHFLFNSLNAVYFLIDKNNIQAREALHTFSGMLRHQLYETKDEKIPVEKEARYLQDYIGLQKLRNENCIVRFSVDPAVKSLFIEPFLLLPFVENAFKHLSHFGEDRRNEVHIDLAKQNGTLEFVVRNTTEAAESSAAVGGIGLANVKRRLELLYPQKHALKAEEKDGWFAVHLQLKIGNE